MSYANLSATWAIVKSQMINFGRPYFSLIFSFRAMRIFYRNKMKLIPIRILEKMSFSRQVQYSTVCRRETLQVNKIHLMQVHTCAHENNNQTKHCEFQRCSRIHFMPFTVLRFYVLHIPRNHSRDHLICVIKLEFALMIQIFSWRKQFTQY